MLPFCYLFASKYELYLTIFQTFFFWNGWKWAITKRGYINIYNKAFFQYKLPRVTRRVINYYLSWNRISVMSFFLGLFMFSTEFSNLFISPLRGFILHFFKTIRKKKYFLVYGHLLSDFIVNKKSKILTDKTILKVFKIFILVGSFFKTILGFLFFNKLIVELVNNFKTYGVYRVFLEPLKHINGKYSISTKFIRRVRITSKKLNKFILNYQVLLIFFINKWAFYVKRKQKIKFSYFFFNIKNTNYVFYKKKIRLKIFHLIKDFSFTKVETLFFKFFFIFFIFFKKCFISVVVGFSIIVFSFYIFKLPFLRTTAGWLLIILFCLWLFSGFNNFLRRYKFGKFTVAVQRFWKRAFTCFWLIEGFLFLIFFYYTLIASAEPKIFFDIMSFYAPHCLNPKKFLLNCFFIVSLILISNLLLVFLKYKKFRQITPYIILITVFLFYLLLKESYQFYYLLNFYNDYFWVLDDTSYNWMLECEVPRARNRLHYTTIIIIAKFWHYIFIFISWVFFVVKSLEQNKIRYTLMSMNVQNFIIFYTINWVCMYSWLKWVFRRFMDQQYYWFFSSFRYSSLTIIVYDLNKLIENAFTFCIYKFLKINNKTSFLLEFYFNHPLQISTTFLTNLWII